MKTHAYDTWRKPYGTGRLWLRDDLPKSTPESRIFLYEYNSSFIFGGEKDRFIHKASELLEELRLERRGVSCPFEEEASQNFPNSAQNEGRPIIFLAHSLGGILVEQVYASPTGNKTLEHDKAE